MAATKQLIATLTVGSTPSGIQFTNIPSSFTDLYIVISARVVGTGITSGMYANFNGDYTGANYVRRTLYGQGGGVGSYLGNAVISVGSAPSASATANVFSNIEMYIPNYSSSNPKVASANSVTENNGTTAEIVIGANRWTGTAAINDINIYSDNGAQVQYSTASLYGITNGSGGATVS